jgi:hypothetical protein
MKLRIHENTLRFRLDDEELERLEETGHLESSVRFGPEDGSRLVYSLTKAPGVKGISAALSGARICVGIEPERAERLTAGEEDSLEDACAVGEEGPLKILVERDLLA